MDQNNGDVNPDEVVRKTEKEWVEFLKNCYENNDFQKQELYHGLAVDSAYESQWVLSALEGRQVIFNFLSEKGKTFARAQLNIKGQILEGDFAGSQFGLLLTENKPGITEEQRMIVVIKINNDGQIQRIDLCIPELFSY